MNTLRFEVSQDVTLLLQVASRDAAVKGWDEDAIEIILDGEQEQCTAELREGTLVVESHVPLSVQVPRSATVRVKEVHGDLILRHLDGDASAGVVHGEGLVQFGGGPVSISEIHGDLTAEGLGGPLSVQEAHADVRLSKLAAPVHLGRVGGDLRARGLDGDLSVGSVHGDVRVRGIAGRVVLEACNGDFSGIDLNGGLDARGVSGDLSLRTALTPGMTYNARAKGDIMVRFPAETSARFTLDAEGTISAKLPQVEEERAGHIVGQAGAGEAEVTLHAGGDLSAKVRTSAEPGLPDFELDFSQDIGAQINAQVAASVGGADLDALTRREIEKAMRKAEREIEKARRQAENGRQRDEERVKRAQERAAQVAGRVERKMASRARHWEGMFDRRVSLGRAGRSPRAPQVSDEEQLTILRMVQEGKISVEEAEKLLKALEG